MSSYSLLGRVSVKRCLLSLEPVTLSGAIQQNNFCFWMTDHPDFPCAFCRGAGNAPVHRWAPVRLEPAQGHSCHGHRRAMDGTSGRYTQRATDLTLGCEWGSADPSVHWWGCTDPPHPVLLDVPPEEAHTGGTGGRGDVKNKPWKEEGRECRRTPSECQQHCSAPAETQIVLCSVDRTGFVLQIAINYPHVAEGQALLTYKTQSSWVYATGITSKKRIITLQNEIRRSCPSGWLWF